MPQFTINKEMKTGKEVTIDGNDAHHIGHVLRLKPESWIVLSDGHGNQFRSKIVEIQKKSVTLLVKEKLPKIDYADVTLAQAVVKHDRLETIIQKAVELGVQRIIPFTSERTIPKFSESASGRKEERWNKIAEEAAKQCGLGIQPKVMPLQTFGDIVQSNDTYDHRLFFYEGEDHQTLQNHFTSSRRSQGGRTIILIGPEGGFAPDEVTLAKKNEWSAIKLGPLIMRVETATISAITLTQYFLGHFDR